MKLEEVIAEVKKSGLRGKGGGGFVTANKWEKARNAPTDEKGTNQNHHRTIEENLPPDGVIHLDVIFRIPKNPSLHFCGIRQQNYPMNYRYKSPYQRLHRHRGMFQIL